VSEKTLLLHYNNSSGSQAEVQVFLNSCPNVKNWVTYLPHSFLVVTDLSPRELSLLFLHFAGEKSMFMIISLTGSVIEGWMPKIAWDVIRDPMPFMGKNLLPSGIIPETN
jgi:hypothetical protein